MADSISVADHEIAKKQRRKLVFVSIYVKERHLVHFGTGQIQFLGVSAGSLIMGI